MAEPLYLGFVPKRNYGWGIASTNLVDELTKLTSIKLVGKLVAPDEDRVLPGVIVQALVNEHLDPLYAARGTSNFGYVFFENELTEQAKINACRFDRIFAGSSWCCERLKEVGIDNTDVLLQGIDPELFFPADFRETSEDFVIFSGGKFELRKGHDLVLKAFSILSKRYPDMRLVTCWYNYLPRETLSLAGSPHAKFEAVSDPAFPTSLDEQIARRVELGRSWVSLMEKTYRQNDVDPSRVTTYPMMDHGILREVYKETDVGLFPNRCESGSNLVMMEYMACKRPVIGSYFSGHTDVLNEQNSILLTDLEKFSLIDPTGRRYVSWRTPRLDEVVAALEIAYHQRETLRSKAEAGARTVGALTWQATANRLLDLVRIHT